MEDIKRMVSRYGFIEIFWERLAASNRNGGKVTQRQIYNEMEDEFEAEYCCNQFPSFDAFKVYLRRLIKSRGRHR